MDKSAQPKEVNKSTQSEETDVQGGLDLNLSSIGSALSNFFEENDYVLPGLVAGALLGGGSSLFNPQSSLMGRALLGGLLGGGLGYGAPQLMNLFGQETQNQFPAQVTDTAVPALNPVRTGLAKQRQQYLDEFQQPGRTTGQTQQNINQLLEQF